VAQAVVALKMAEAVLDIYTQVQSNKVFQEEQDCHHHYHPLVVVAEQLLLV
jgi:hypothetical protein